LRSKTLLIAAGLLSFPAVTVAAAGPRVEQLGNNLYAYISDNEHSANSTFLIGKYGILVVDSGSDEIEGRKLLSEIRKLSSAPIQFLVNTHYHPDHQGANAIVGPDAMVISSPFTRERTLQLMARMREAPGKRSADPPPGLRLPFRVAAETLSDRLIIYLDEDTVEIVAPGPGHTMGDVYVYFPKQRSIAAGDLFMSRSSPAMDQGSAANWIRTLDKILALPADHFVPGHFEVGTRETFTRFRDYMADLYAQVERLQRSGATVEQVRQQIDMKKYADFRQYPQFQATFADNAESIYQQLEHPQ
jgi:cyclase